MVVDDGSNSDTSSTDTGWIAWYCSLVGHSYLIEVDEDFASDTFNYYGLRNSVSNFEYAVTMMTGNAPSADDLKKMQYQDILKKAKELYSLIHARYILSPGGLQCMREKYLRGDFGVCPRVLCDNEKVLPVGLSEELHLHRVRVYCQRCQEAYNIRDSGRILDGASFGTSFPHVFLQTFPELVSLQPPIPYVPKIFGFKVFDCQSIVQTKLDKGEYGKGLIYQRAESAVLDEIDSSDEAEDIREVTSNELPVHSIATGCE